MRAMEQVEVLRAACCVAGADGNATDEERQLLANLASKSGVGAASLNAMIERATSDQKFCEEQFRILKTEPQETMAILLQVAMADGAIQDVEVASLKALASRLNVSDDIFEALIAKTKSMLG